MEDSMNLKYQYAALAALMVVVSSGANAQRATRNDRADGFSQSVSYATYLKGKDLRASEIVGKRVRNAAGDTLGEIKELVIPTTNQNDMLVVVSVGGLADIGDKLVALPYKDLRISPDGDTYYFDRTEAQLKAAPAFSFDSRAETQARVQPARDAQPVPAAPARTEPTVTTRTASPATATTTTDRPRVAPSAAVAKAENLKLDVFDYRASDLIGAAVLDDRGQHVAKVDD